MPSRKVVRQTDGRTKAARAAAGKPMAAKSRMQQLIDGDITIDDLDDEEIRRGRCRNSAGNFGGRPPDKLPKKLHDAMRKAFYERVQSEFEEDLALAQETLREVMRSRHAAAPARVRAAELILERGLGKVPDKLQQTVEVKPYEQDIEALLIDVEPGDDNVYPITTKEEAS